jgi:hypothetical protein
VEEEAHGGRGQGKKGATAVAVLAAVLFRAHGGASVCPGSADGVPWWLAYSTGAARAVGSWAGATRRPA